MKLLFRVGLVMAVLFVAVGVGASAAMRSAIDRRTVVDAVRVVEATALAVTPSFAPADLARDFRPLDAARVATIRTALNRLLASNDVRDVTIWSARHWVVYSTDPNLIGHWRPSVPELRSALRGTRASSVSWRAGPSGANDGGRQVLAVFAPLLDETLTRSEPIGAVQVDVPYGPIAATIASDTRRMQRVLVGSLAALFVALLTVVGATTRRLRGQSRRNHHLAFHDALTGLANRQLLLERIDDALQPGRSSGSGVAVLVFGLDRFKELTTSLGPDGADAVVVEVTKRLSSRLRDTDTLGRIASDAFVVVLPGLTFNHDAPTVAGDLLAALAEPVRISAPATDGDNVRGSDAGSGRRTRNRPRAKRSAMSATTTEETTGVSVDVHCTAGISIGPEHSADPADLLRFAEMAADTARAAFTDVETYVVADELTREARRALVSDLRRGMAARELELVYQPMLDLATGGVSKCEAFVRWRHRERGLLEPGAFLPLIESTELIKPLTMYLVRRSLEDMALMAAAGFSLRVAVNLAPSCLLDLRFAGELVEALHEAGLDSSALELEFTERAVHENPTRVRQVLDSLADAGFDIAVDDFGAGQAPIVYLTQLPISSLKIDPEFARDVHQRTASAAVVSFTVALARSLHLRVVAEGVENIEAFRSLVQMGCDEIQGYLVARPLRPGDLVEFMRGVQAHGVRLALDTSDAIVLDEPNDVASRTSAGAETA